MELVGFNTNGELVHQQVVQDVSSIRKEGQQHCTLPTAYHYQDIGKHGTHNPFCPGK